MTGREQALTPAQVADWLNVNPRTLEQWRYKRRGPAFFRTGAVRGPVRYWPADVRAYLKQRQHQPRRTA